MNLDAFRNTTLTYTQYTVFAPNSGVDGTLTAPNGHVVPLDTYAQVEDTFGLPLANPGDFAITDAVIALANTPDTQNDVNTAIATFARDHLNSTVTFDTH